MVKLLNKQNKKIRKSHRMGQLLILLLVGYILNANNTFKQGMNDKIDNVSSTIEGIKSSDGDLSISSALDYALSSGSDFIEIIEDNSEILKNIEYQDIEIGKSTKPPMQCGDTIIVDYSMNSQPISENNNELILEDYRTNEHQHQNVTISATGYENMSDYMLYNAFIGMKEKGHRITKFTTDLNTKGAHITNLYNAQLKTIYADIKLNKIVQHPSNSKYNNQNYTMEVKKPGIGYSYTKCGSIVNFTYQIADSQSLLTDGDQRMQLGSDITPVIIHHGMMNMRKGEVRTFKTPVYMLTHTLSGKKTDSLISDEIKLASDTILNLRIVLN